LLPDYALNGSWIIPNSPFSIFNSIRVFRVFRGKILFIFNSQFSILNLVKPWLDSF
jgi:hypothetical protein